MSGADSHHPWHFNPPSPWGEGRRRRWGSPGRRNFNPPSPWGEGQFLPGEKLDLVPISIHPPRGGRDFFLPPSRCWTAVFQSTLPVGGGTAPRAALLPRGYISIHPPRGGRDPAPGGGFLWTLYFNPPSPWGEGHRVGFYSCETSRISIHPPRGGRDPSSRI